MGEAHVLLLGISMCAGCSPRPQTGLGLTAFMKFLRSNVLSGIAPAQHVLKMVAVALLVAVTITICNRTKLVASDFVQKKLYSFGFFVFKTLAFCAYAQLVGSFSFVVYKKGWSFGMEFIALSV